MGLLAPPIGIEIKRVAAGIIFEPRLQIFQEELPGS